MQLAEEGYDPVYGARPLKRVIQQRLQNQLATEMLGGKLGSRGLVRVDYRDGKFRLENGVLDNSTTGSATSHTRVGMTK